MPLLVVDVVLEIRCRKTSTFPFFLHKEQLMLAQNLVSIAALAGIFIVYTHFSAKYR